ncbi:MAG: hypothetical protein JW959_07130, partial [Pirellulales bacterium]|nr:hypothetical protein [Pirellulales bacterium]
MSCLRYFSVFIGLTGLWLASPSKSADNPAGDSSEVEVSWRADYAKAMTEAENDNKMMFIYFCDPEGDELCNRFKKETLDDPRISVKLREYVCVQLPLDAKIKVRSEEIVLLEDESFAEMLGKPGIAIVDFRSTEASLRGAVVSTFPITDKLWYTAEQMAVILNLPAGTLTQRTLIYAVRTHPDKPESTDGEPLPTLLEEARNHS